MLLKVLLMPGCIVNKLERTPVHYITFEPYTVYVLTFVLLVILFVSGFIVNTLIRAPVSNV